MQEMGNGTIVGIVPVPCISYANQCGVGESSEEYGPEENATILLCDLHFYLVISLSLAIIPSGGSMTGGESRL